MMASYTDVVVLRHPQPGAVGVSVRKATSFLDTHPNTITFLIGGWGMGGGTLEN